MSNMNRRDFIRLGGAAAAAVLLASCAPQGSGPAATGQRPLPAGPTGSQAYLAAAHGNDPGAITRAAIQSLGGIERFVKSGQTVIIKPNICVDYHTEEYAATTNPAVVAALVALCLGAGAKKVSVMDNPLGGTADSAYSVTGIGAAVKAAGGEMQVMNPNKFISYTIPLGKDLKSWKFYQDVMEADVVIDVPIAKQHSLARLTLGCKNLLGAVGDPNKIHQNLGQRVAEITSLIRPNLTVVDAYRILLAHGPTGGSLNDVKAAHTVIASHDIVAADSYGATLFDLTGSDIGFVKAAAEMGLGTLDLKSIKVEEINV